MWISFEADLTALQIEQKHPRIPQKQSCDSNKQTHKQTNKQNRWIPATTNQHEMLMLLSGILFTSQIQFEPQSSTDGSEV